MSKTWYPRGNFGPEVQGDYVKDKEIRGLNLKQETDSVKDGIQNILPIDVEKLNRFLKGKD